MLGFARVLYAVGAIAALAAAPPAATLRLADRVDHVDFLLAREPMVVETPDGALFVSGYGTGRPTLWKSVDHGANWKLVNVGTAEGGAVGNSDVDLAVAPDGALFYVNMTFDAKKMEGTRIAVGVSPDSGTHWGGAHYPRIGSTTVPGLLWLMGKANLRAPGFRDAAQLYRPTPA